MTSHSPSDQTQGNDAGKDKRKFDVWCEILLVSSRAIALSLDPLFFFVPVIHEDKKCISEDKNMWINAVLWRSLLDFIYLVYFVKKFYEEKKKDGIESGSEVPVESGSEVPVVHHTLECGHVIVFKCVQCAEGQKGKEKKDKREKFPRKLSIWMRFVIDILVILPIPQVLMPIIISEMRHAKFADSVTIINAVSLFQYGPRVLQIYLSLKEMDDIDISIQIKASFNFFLYLLAGHFFWFKPPNKSIHMGKRLCTGSFYLWLVIISLFLGKLADTSPHMALVIKSETSRRVAQENQNQTYKCETCKRPTRSEYLELYRAALEGNWDKAKRVVEEYPEAIRDSVTETRDVLHIAFASKHTAFVKEVVRFLTDEDLERINVNGDTALCFAAKLGTVKIAKEMVKKNNRLPLIRSSEERTPLHIAAKLGSRDMTSYLCDVTPIEGLSPDERIEILMATITNDMYDIALKILEKDVTLGTTKDKKTVAALRELAKKPFVIGGKSRLSLWERCFNFGFKGIRDKTTRQALVHEMVTRVWIAVQQFKGNRFSNIFLRTPLFDAAEFGNAEFLIILIRTYPDMIWTTNHFHRSLFLIAVINRQESVYKLIHEMGAIKEIILTYVDAYKQNILHLAGKLAPKARLNLVPGAALQMQRELLWFKEVEKIVPPSYPKMRDNENRTPWELFTKEHKKLRREGEKWMKDTVNFYIIVATLITGVVFAAAFTVPGGSNQDTGIPIF